MSPVRGMRHINRTIFSFQDLLGWITGDNILFRLIRDPDWKPKKAQLDQAPSPELRLPFLYVPFETKNRFFKQNYSTVIFSAIP
jgi:hypothetical protein